MANLSSVTPELVAHIEHLKQESIDNATSSADETARERCERVFPLRWGDNDPIFKQFDHSITSNGRELKLRIYQPENSKGTIVFLHGGGWMNGSIYTHDGSCILFANQSQMTVMAVNYSKAPEYKFPQGLNDGIAALEWLMKNGVECGLDTSNVMLCGKSSGGNIVAVIAHYARDKGINLNGQILIYPAVDAHMNSQSFKTFEQGYMVSAADLAGCYNAYLPPNADRTDPQISPLLSSDFSGICPTFIATCDHDPLRDDGRAYAAKLCQAGVNTTLVEMSGALHGIWIMKAITPLAEIIINHAANWVKTQNLT